MFALRKYFIIIITIYTLITHPHPTPPPNGNELPLANEPLPFGEVGAEPSCLGSYELPLADVS